MAGWHHRLDGRESEWTPGDGDGQGGLVCCNSWGRKESDTTERLNWANYSNQASMNSAKNAAIQQLAAHNTVKCVSVEALGLVGVFNKRLLFTPSFLFDCYWTTSLKAHTCFLVLFFFPCKHRFWRNFSCLKTHWWQVKPKGDDFFWGLFSESSSCFISLNKLIPYIKIHSTDSGISQGFPK